MIFIRSFDGKKNNTQFEQLLRIVHKTQSSNIFYYRPQRSCEGYVFTGVCLSTDGGGGVLSQHALQVVSQHALQQVSRGVLSQHVLQVVSQYALQQVSGGGCLLLEGACYLGLPAPRRVPAPGGCLLPGGACSQWGVPGLGGLVWPSVMAFCCGLLLCPSVMAFWFGAFWLKVAIWYGLGEKAITEGHHTRRPYQKAIREDHFQPEGCLQSEGHHTRRP